MEAFETKDIVVPTELAAGLVEVLQKASGRGGLKGTARKQAQWYANVLTIDLVKNKGTQSIRVPMEVVAYILKLLLMIALPESLVHVIMMTIEKMY